MHNLSHNDAILEMLSLSDSDEARLLPYLSFELNQAFYAVDILRVEDIRGWQPVTPVPNTPEYLCGVLGWHDEIVPVIDLRLLLEMPFHPYSKTTVVVFLNLTSRRVGIVVDAVYDAYYVDPESIFKVPDFGDRVSTEFISGMAHIDDNLVMLLDIEQLLHQERLG